MHEKRQRLEVILSDLGPASIVAAVPMSGAVRQERSRPLVLALEAWFELQLTRVSGRRRRRAYPLRPEPREVQPAR
jgi:hypothetical protein